MTFLNPNAPVNGSLKIARRGAPLMSSSKPDYRNADSFENNFIDRIEVLKRKAVNTVDKITDAPNVIRERADNLTDRLIGIGNDFKSQASGVAENNLKKGKIKGIGSDVAGWLSTGQNWVYALVGAALIAFLAFRGLK